MSTPTLHTGFPKSKIFFDFEEVSLGQYVLTKFSSNKRVRYILSSQNDCGIAEIVEQGEVEGVRVTAADPPPTKVFNNLRDGVYLLSVSVEDLPSESVIIYNFPSLECLILESIEDIFSHCNSCKDDIDPCQLLAKMNYFMILSNIEISSTLLSKFRCILTGKVEDSILKERNKGRCKDDLRFLLAINYLAMYDVRNFKDKKIKYNYEKIVKYITSNVITLR